MRVFCSHYCSSIIAALCTGGGGGIMHYQQKLIVTVAAIGGYAKVALFSFFGGALNILVAIFISVHVTFQ